MHARGSLMKISFAELTLPRSGAVVVATWEDRALTASARLLDEATGGAISRAVAAAPRFHGKKNELIPIIGPPNLPLTRIVVAGLGKPDKVDQRLLQDLGGSLVAHLNGAGEKEATFAIDLGDAAPVKPADAAAHLAFGAELRSYRFDKYRTKEKPEQKPSLTGITVAAEAVFFTRDLVSEPANTLYPETLAEEAARLTEFSLSVEVLDENRMAEF